ncbi:hypothetical protein CRYUN_Cryun35bG0083200 [Craigia yunnanensis]
MDPENEDLPQYEHIFQNDFSYRKHKKQKEEDIAICECKFDFSDPDSACGERCLNVLTSTKCTPGYCPCDVYCKNQVKIVSDLRVHQMDWGRGRWKFQKCQYARTTLFKTEGRGWGLLAAENIKYAYMHSPNAGRTIYYRVLWRSNSWKDAKRRSQAYENQGLKDAFIISLNGSESIDATKKGSLARFINHSCQPNCETRKWTALVEIRVGIFAKQDIAIGTELAYDYNFEWYGGAKVRCLCGSPNCSGFLGAKSRGFQSIIVDVNVKSEHQLQSTVDTVPMEAVIVNTLKTESTEDMNFACRHYHIISGPMPKKKSQHYSNGKSRHLSKNQIDLKHLAEFLSSKEAQEEVFRYEELKNEAACQLASLYDEIRPAIEEHERDNQDSVSTSVAEKWIEASCSKLKIEFDFHSSILKNIVCTPPKTCEQVKPGEMEGGNDNEVKLLEF